MIFSTWGKDHACQGAVFDSDDFLFCIFNIKKGGQGTWFLKTESTLKHLRDSQA
jgi:hypothetical protein